MESDRSRKSSGRPSNSDDNNNNNAPGNNGGTARTSRLRLGAADWHALRDEPGVEEVAWGVYRTRRGSFMLHTREREGGVHNVSILHSERTANLLHSIESAPRDEPGKRAKRKAPPAYSSPDFPGSTQGHIAKVSRYEGTAKGGFELKYERDHHSGKAGGEFPASKMKSLRARGWPDGKSEDTHHSEADYAHTFTPSGPERPGKITVHQMKGVNDMCEFCRNGTANAVATQGSSHHVAYVGQKPFKTQGAWGEVPGTTAVGPGQIVRSRPEQMLSKDERNDHLARAQFMAQLRSPRPRQAPPELPPVSGPPRRKDDQPPPPPPSGGSPGASMLPSGRLKVN